MSVLEESLGFFGLLVGQKKQFEDADLSLFWTLVGETLWKRLDDKLLKNKRRVESLCAEDQSFIT